MNNLVSYRNIMDPANILNINCIVAPRKASMTINIQYVNIEIHHSKNKV
jgi:hypothetical protein